MTGDLAFVVLGRAQPKGSTRSFLSRTGKIATTDSNRNAKPWAARVAAAAREAIDEDPNAQPALIRGPVVVTVAFHFSRPRAHYGIGRNINRLKPSAPSHMATMPDVDKLARCVLDALVGVLIRDDGQVVNLHAGKRFGEPERAEIRVRVLA